MLGFDFCDWALRRVALRGAGAVAWTALLVLGGVPMPGGAQTAGQNPAFPGAMGFGGKVTGGRAGTVYHVTNLSDAGAGSFRDAVSVANRIVVFDVGGTIVLKTAVAAKSDLTIAGQSAPGGGIALRGGELSFAKQSNIICRHLRIRPGSETASDNDDALSLYLARDAVFDHCSFEFAPWNNIDGVSDDYQNHPVTNITFQYCLIADPTGQQFGAHCESVIGDWTWYGNLFANSHNRNPLAKVNDVFMNNVLYNYSSGYTTHTSTEFKHDIIGNYFIFGPASTGTDNTWFQVDKNQSIFASGNLKDNNLDGALNGQATTPYWYQGTGIELTAAWSPVSATLPQYNAASAYRMVTSQAGAMPWDPMDKLILSQVQTLGKGTTGTGAGTVGPGGDLYTSQTQTGLSDNGYGAITDVGGGGTPDPDGDKDGMPDYWEAAMGLDPKSNDAMKIQPDGYAAIEQYLNWLGRFHARAAAGAAGVDVDLAALVPGFAKAAPTFSVGAVGGGTGASGIGTGGSVTLAADKHTAHFTPTVGFSGVAAFGFSVQGNDATRYQDSVMVLVAPGGTLGLRGAEASGTGEGRSGAGNGETLNGLGLTSRTGANRLYRGKTVLGRSNGRSKTHSR